MLKNYPFHKENEQQYWIKKEQKHQLTYEYKEKFGERYIDNLTPCERQAVLNFK